MTVTYEAIASYTIPSAQASYTFSSIPTTYTDVVLVASGLVGSPSLIEVQVGNGSIDTGSNYSSTFMYGNGSSAVSSRASSQTNWIIDVGTSTSSTGTTILQFMNYSNTTTNKSALFRSNTSGIVIAFAALWRSTSAINTIKIAGYSGSNLLTGSTFSLYGIKAE
jgi:hypothetical protein